MRSPTLDAARLWGLGLEQAAKSGNLPRFIGFPVDQCGQIPPSWTSGSVPPGALPWSHDQAGKPIRALYEKRPDRAGIPRDLLRH
jgi:hypothetical protein